MERNNGGIIKQQRTVRRQTWNQDEKEGSQEYIEEAHLDTSYTDI